MKTQYNSSQNPKLNQGYENETEISHTERGRRKIQPNQSSLNEPKTC